MFLILLAHLACAIATSGSLFSHGTTMKHGRDKLHKHGLLRKAHTNNYTRSSNEVACHSKLSCVIAKIWFHNYIVRRCGDGCDDDQCDDSDDTARNAHCVEPKIHVGGGTLRPLTSGTIDSRVSIVRDGENTKFDFIKEFSRGPNGVLYFGRDFREKKTAATQFWIPLVAHGFFERVTTRNPALLLTANTKYSDSNYESRKFLSYMVSKCSSPEEFRRSCLRSFGKVPVRVHINFIQPIKVEAV